VFLSTEVDQSVDAFFGHSLKIRAEILIVSRTPEKVKAGEARRKYFEYTVEERYLKHLRKEIKNNNYCRHVSRECSFLSTDNFWVRF